MSNRKQLNNKISQKKKNVSQRIPNGRTLQTRDEFLESGKNYKKPGYENKGYYRKIIVIDSNRQGDLVVVKGTTHGIGIDGLEKTKFKPFVETQDNEGKPIRPGKKFIQNNPRKDLNKHQVNQIKKETYKKSMKKNREKTRKLKGRR